MRKEASLEQWKELYSVAMRIKDLKPWEYLWDVDIITILPSYNEEPSFCSIMGNGGQCFGVSTYVGFKAVSDLYKIKDNKDIPPEQLIRYQNNMICYFGDREDLTNKEYKLIKDLGFKFRGKNNWIYFRAFEKGYAPYMLDEEQVIKQTEILKHLFMALKAMYSGVEVDFERGNTLLRRYDEESKLWLNHEAPRFVPNIQYNVPVLQDEVLFARLIKRTVTKDILELDIIYINSIVNDKNYDKPIIPKMCVLANGRSEMILSHSMLAPEDREVDAIFDIVINHIMKNGKPKTIFVRDEYMESLLSDICQRLNIKLQVRGKLEAIDSFSKGLMRRWTK